MRLLPVFNAMMELAFENEQVSSGSTFPGYRTGLLAILCFPFILSLLHGDDRLVYLGCGMACLLSVSACFSASYRAVDEKFQWRLLAISGAVISVSYFAIVLRDYAVLSYTHAAWISNLAASAQKILLIPAMMGSRASRSPVVRFLDTVVTVLACAMLMFTLGSGSLPAEGPIRVWTGLVSWVVLSLLAVCARFLQVSPGLQWFYVVLARYCCCTAAVVAVTNVLIPKRYPNVPDAPVNFLISLPELLLCLWTMQAVPQLRPGRVRLNRAVIDSTQFSLLMLCSVALALFAFRHHLLIATSLVLIAVLCSAIRTQAFYSLLHRESNHLRTEAAAYHQLATLDPLTGIGNRRWFDMNLERRLLETSTGPCTLLLIDIDHFKLINDTNGHQAGDEMLCLIANLMQREAGFDESTCISRIGGDEFAILLPEHATSALRIASRIRASVEKAASRRGFPVTVSIGAATSGIGSTAFSLFRQADEAMYRVKAAGRNGVESFT